MNYVGVDLHKQTISVCVISQASERRHARRFRCEEELRIAEFFEQLGSLEVVVEATASYEWFLKLVEPHAQRIVLAHPGKLRVIAESTRKSDKLDARVLAEFLALGMIPEAHRPTPRLRAHRSLVRHRQYVQQRITAVKVKLRRILSDYNADQRDLFTRAGRKVLARFELSPTDRFRVDELSGLLDFLQTALERANWRLREFATQGATTEHEARTGKKKAITAIARRLLCVMVAILKTRQPFMTAPIPNAN